MKNFQGPIAILTIVFAFSLFGVLIFKGAEKEILMFVLGSLVSLLGQIFGYFFDSMHKVQGQGISKNEQKNEVPIETTVEVKE